jgi:hypothetical protein
MEMWECEWPLASFSPIVIASEAKQSQRLIIFRHVAKDMRTSNKVPLIVSAKDEAVSKLYNATPVYPVLRVVLDSLFFFNKRALCIE